MELNPTTIGEIINLLHEFQVKEEVYIPETPYSPADDWARQTLSDHIDDPSYHELLSMIADLEPDQQAELVALMWIGRGDYGEKQWDQAVRHARGEWNTRTNYYVTGTPLAADYLQEGLNQLGYSTETSE